MMSGATDDKNLNSTFRRSPTLNSSIVNRVTTVTSTFDQPSVIIANDRSVTIRGGSEVSFSRESAVVSYGQSGEIALDVPLLQNDGGEESKALHRKLDFAYNVSWIVNIILLISKAYVWWISGSKSVLASLVDSFVDLVSQVVIFIAEWQSQKMDPRFPVGQARLETIGVLACALIMALSSYQVILESAGDLYNGLVEGLLPTIDASLIMYVVLGSATVLKAICYMLCSALASKSDSMVALAEDHLNDIMSNLAAAITACIAIEVDNAWWVDGAGAITISLYILWRWFDIAKGQVDKIVGRGAPEDFLEQLSSIASEHSQEIAVDCIRAYYFGSKYMVEMEIVMPVTTTFKHVHDISLSLQNKLESLDCVERAFVHADYESRSEPEHRTERLLQGLPVVREASAETLTTPALK
ncbi:hypothetical protein CEUSTIGMA_g9797.t1 [Chlamydomonas eustigma]|uniref:Cation efflux protein cytoplasmic domain-containing protein n=1 Tax=Chlamydomonas eustigma TaxID=1157962 RepID=A0A250XH16_9CHLO|nr:hypothetical protein CEUSTIGMA_g9797.t1 [Chlamydomonas eustigma]|eukprot:GAX82368.1 hypothetical protein CEUSTIGMA_g9797.t1 [Chlamydomonas eustigma]